MKTENQKKQRAQVNESNNKSGLQLNQNMMEAMMAGSGEKDVFKENNIKKRQLFWREPLIKWLWNKFTDMCPDVTINHLRRTRSNPLDGEYRY